MPEKEGAVTKSSFHPELGKVNLHLPGGGIFRATTGAIEGFKGMPLISEATGPVIGMISEWEQRMRQKGFRWVGTISLTFGHEKTWQSLGYEPATADPQNNLWVKALTDEGRENIAQAQQAAASVTDNIEFSSRKMQTFIEYLGPALDMENAAAFRDATAGLTVKASDRAIRHVFRNFGYTEGEIAAHMNLIRRYLTAQSVFSGVPQEMSSTSHDFMTSSHESATHKPTTGEAFSIPLKGQDASSRGEWSIAVADGVSNEGINPKLVTAIARESAQFATRLLDDMASQFEQTGDYTLVASVVSQRIIEFARYAKAKYRGGAGTTLMAVGKIGGKLLVIRIGDSFAFCTREGSDDLEEIDPLEIEPSIQKMLARKNPERFQAIDVNQPYTIGFDIHPPKISWRGVFPGMRVVVASDGAKGVVLQEVSRVITNPQLTAGSFSRILEERLTQKTGIQVKSGKSSDLEADLKADRLSIEYDDVTVIPMFF